KVRRCVGAPGTSKYRRTYVAPLATRKGAPAEFHRRGTDAMEFFLNPWSMVAGGAMISAPILIHLINRMRFKRIRWAAMEFLLKSQKRSRRRLIIEQLILLMLRCLMMVLAGLLLARFIGYQPPPEPDEAGTPIVFGTLHVALLDDTLSMTDRRPQDKAEEGADAFSV